MLDRQRVGPAGSGRFAWRHRAPSTRDRVRVFGEGAAQPRGLLALARKGRLYPGQLASLVLDPDGDA